MTEVGTISTVPTSGACDSPSLAQWIRNRPDDDRDASAVRVAIFLGWLGAAEPLHLVAEAANDLRLRDRLKHTVRPYLGKTKHPSFPAFHEKFPEPARRIADELGLSMPNEEEEAEEAEGPFNLEESAPMPAPDGVHALKGALPGVNVNVNTHTPTEEPVLGSDQASAKQAVASREPAGDPTWFANITREEFTLLAGLWQGSACASNVYLFLKLSADAAGKCYPSRFTIAEACKTTDRTVATTLSLLKEVGLLEWVRRGKKHSNKYFLPYHANLSNLAKKVQGDRKRASHHEGSDRKRASHHNGLIGSVLPSEVNPVREVDPPDRTGDDQSRRTETLRLVEEFDPDFPGRWKTAVVQHLNPSWIYEQIAQVSDGSASKPRAAFMARVKKRLPERVVRQLEAAKRNGHSK